MKTLKRTLSMLLVLCMVLSFVPFGAFAAATTGTTQNQPFPSGTGGSTYFRIPALTVLSDGTLVAAADARWSQYMDKGNIDTIVSVSEDKGANWNYTFANYIADYSDSYDIKAATFIDPAMAVKTVDGVETIYMVADLFPGQKSGDTMCIHAALYGTGMDENGHLLVSDVNDNTLSDFHYYVGDYTNGMAPLCNSDGSNTDYTVDEWFNVYKGNTLLGNLFTYGAAYDSDAQKTFYVYQTCYLVLTKSTDGGETWSAPTMLNHQVKDSSEKFYGVGPASGFVTSTGRIMFTAYTFTTADGNSSVFYSDDNGVTWTRAASVAEQTSEACLTEANGTIYMFTRHGNYYYYSTDNGTTWSGAQAASGISYLDSCEVSVMTYSEKIDGKTAILLSAPTASGRYGGKIFVGLVNDDHSITWKYTYAVNTTSDRYQYSSLKELNDGSLGLLYENGDASIVYKNIAITDVIGEDAVIGTPEKTINMTVGDEKTFTLDEVVNSGSHTSDAADITWTKNDTTVSVPAAQLGSDNTYSGDTINLNDCLYTFTKNGDVWEAEANGIYLYPGNTTSTGYPNRATAYSNLSIEAGYEDDTFYIKSNDCDKDDSNTSYLYFDRTNLKWDRVDSPGSNTTWMTNCSLMLFKATETATQADGAAIPGFEQVTDVAAADLESGEYLVVAPSSDGSTLYALYPSTETGTRYNQIAKITGGYTDVTTSETTVTIYAKAVGNTSVEIDGTKYNITVEPESDPNVVNVEVEVGKPETITDESGVYTSATTEPDSNVVEMELKPVETVTDTEIGEAVTTITEGKYVIYTYLNAYVTNKGEGNYIDLSATEQTVWNVAVADSTAGTYYITDSDGNYLTVGSGTAGVTTTQTAVKLVYGTSTDTPGQSGFFIQDANGSYNLNNSGGTDNAYGKSNANGSFSRWQFKPYSETVKDSTEITFTGVTPGNTTAVVGGTTYNITVTLPEGMSVVDVELEVGEEKIITDETGNYVDDITREPDDSIAEMTVSGVTGTTETTVSATKATELEDGATYIIRVFDTVYALSSDTGRGDWGTTTRAFQQNNLTAETKHMWTLEASGNGYKLKNANGYLNLGSGNNAATLDQTGEVFTITYTSTGWTIGNAYGRYINALGGLTTYYSAGGWTADGTRFDLYKVTLSTFDSTEITFEGVSEGKTSAIVGNTLYNINVSYREEAVAAYVGAAVSVTPNGTVTEAEITAFNEANGDNVTVELVDGKLVFTGVTADTTATAKVGNVIYNITVKESEIRNITLYVGVTLNDFIDGFSYNNTQSTQPDNTYAYIHSVTTENGGSKVVFSGVAATPEGEVITANVGHVIYNITVKELHSGEDVPGFNCVIGEDQYTSGASQVENLSGKEVKSLRITAGAEFNLGVDITDADSIEWVSSNPDAATVDDTGKITAVAEGTTLVTAEVTKDGVTESISVHVTVVPSMVEGYSDSEISHVVYYIDQVHYTDPFYTMFLSSVNSTGPVEDHTMVMVMEGEVLYYERPKNDVFAMVWTSDPWDGYALTTMGATNTRGEYYPLQSDEGVLGSGGIYYKGSTPYNNIINYANTAGVSWQAALDELLEYNVHVGEDIWEDFGCDGAMSMSRLENDNNPNVATSLTFVSEKLPEVSKSINGVMPSSTEKDEYGNDVIRCKLADWQVYKDGLYARVGDFLYFTINVRIEAPHAWELDSENNQVTDDYGPLAALKYSIGTDEVATLTDDVLPGAYFYTKVLDGLDGNQDGVAGDNDDGYIINEALKSTTQDITDALNRGWTDEEIAAGYRNLEYYVVYRIQESDENSEVVNTVKLDYTFKSAYSAGTKNASSNAEASLYVLGESLQDLVIDFGLPVSFTVTRDDLAHTFDVDKSNKAQGGCLYGTISMEQIEGAETTDVTTDDEWIITYTPNKILQNYDVVYLLNSNGDLQNFFRVYPATTVYYEEGFLFTGDVTGNWQPESKNMGTGPQKTEALGSKLNEAYGYDAHYANHSTGSDNSAASSTAVGDKTVFTFTGTGFDLYANSNSGSGYVTLYSEGKLSKIYMIDTKLTDLDGKEMSGTYYSLPIISEKTLPYGEYTVYLMHSNDSAPISIDGIRIINTIEDSKIFVNDEEDDPEFYELRDYVLNAIDVEKLTESDYISSEDRVALVDAVSKMAGQVYNAMGEDVNAVVINEDGTSFESGEAQKLLDNGPKNELYLYHGQTLAFSVTTNRVMQLGLKSPVGNAKFTMTVDGVEQDLDTLTTTVDMFYKIAGKAENETVHTVSITVNDGVLSVTSLKVCDDPNFTFNALTEKDVENVMLGMYGLLPELPVNPFEDVADDAFYYDAVLWALENSITTGTEATIFAPDSITNRAQVVTFLWRAMGEPEHSVTENPFVDIAESDYFYDAVLWAFEKGITNGVDVTHFDPTGECNRAQVVTFLWRTVGEPVSEFVAEFEDVEPGKFYSDAVAWAIEKGITFGMDDATFGVLNPCNRAQVVTFLYRASSK